VDVLTDRKNILQEILKIEDKITAMRMNPIYLKIKHNLHYLEQRRLGSTIVPISSPDDLSKMLSIRHNSAEMKETIQRYREKKNELDAQMGDLFEKKEILEKQLFD
jgi:hypothetical protein